MATERICGYVSVADARDQLSSSLQLSLGIVQLMGQMQVVTSSLSLARELWRYGEPDLAQRARQLAPEDVIAIGARVEALLSEAQRLWPDGPKGSALMLATVEHLEGRPRPCARRRRLPEARLPEELRATEEQRWAALRDVTRVLDRRRAGKG